MKQILFVDDEPFILEALQRSLYSMRDAWKMRFANGGAEALKLMAEHPADVVVSDMRMPEMNGAQLLNEVARLHPKTVRVILSGFSDLEMIMDCLSGTHQFLTKPCNADTLKDVVGRALDMDEWVNNDKLKAIVSRMGTLPSMPTLYFDILKELGSPQATIENVGITIAQDPGMTAKMLQLVNSAFFGLRRQLTDPAEAVSQLGLETIKSLVLGIHVFSEFESSEKDGLSVQNLWQHSLATAATARRIAQWERQENNIVEESFTAGLLHDVGRLVFISNLPAEYAAAMKRSRDEQTPLVEIEKEVFGASHAEVGGYLLGLWGLPISLVEAAVFHHAPRQCRGRQFGPLSMVHASNVLAHERAEGLSSTLLPQMDYNYLGQIGMWERAQVWRHIPGEGLFGRAGA
jgi:HD-like signal output (HDOD) protein